MSTAGKGANKIRKSDISTGLKNSPREMVCSCVTDINMDVAEIRVASTLVYCSAQCSKPEIAGSFGTLPVMFVFTV